MTSIDKINDLVEELAESGVSLTDSHFAYMGSRAYDKLLKEMAPSHYIIPHANISKVYTPHGPIRIIESSHFLDEDAVSLYENPILGILSKLGVEY